MPYLTTSAIEGTIHCEEAGFWCPHTALNDHGSRSSSYFRSHLDSYFCRGQQEAAVQTTLPSYDPSCYLCPGNKRAQGDFNPKYESTFAFVNDYSAVKEDQAEYKPVNNAGSMLPGCELNGKF